MTNHYQTLGVSRDSGPDEIKKAYRKKQIEHHPDRNPNDPGAEERFKQITLAYEVLSDPQKKQIYDCGFTSSGRFDPKQVDLNLLDPDKFVKTFVNLFGDYLDQQIPGGFRRRVDNLAEHMRQADKKKQKKTPKKRSYGCSTCKDTGRVMLKQGNFKVFVACRACEHRRAS